MRRTGRSGLGLAVILAAVIAAGGACNVESPTQPTTSPSTTTTGGALTGEAVVSGELVQGSALSSDSYAAATAGVANVHVSVVGTSIADTTDDTGHFWLPNAPSGDLQLQFVSGNLNAQLSLSGVSEAVEITVQVQGSGVQLVGSTQNTLDRFNELALSVTIKDPVAGVGTIDLEHGDVATVDDTTMWDPKGDYLSLTEVEAALAGGAAVMVKGQGTRDPATGDILTSQIRATLHAAGTAAAKDFDGLVASATGTDPDGTILLVSNSKGLILQVNVDATTVWDPSGDYVNLTQLIAALGGGAAVNVQGSGVLGASGTFILAGTIRAELVPPPSGGFATQIQAIQALIAHVQVVAAGSGLNNGQINALVSKLNAAIQSLTKGNVNPAVGQINAFINQVNAFEHAGKIAAADATALIQEAQAIISSLP